MGPNNYRSHSMPPAPTINLVRVKDSRITKPPRPSIQHRTKDNDGACPLGPPPGNPNGSVETPSSTHSRALSRCSACSAPKPTKLGPEVPLTYYTTSGLIIGTDTDLSLLSECTEHIATVFKNSRILYEIGVRKGWIPSLQSECVFPDKQLSPSRIDTRRESRAKRKAILDQAGKTYPLKNGKPSPVNKLLAAYGRNEFPLGGRMATSHTKQGTSRCRECQTSDADCVIVEQDNFWTRSQCVLCVQRKTTCSLDVIGTKRGISEE